MQVARCPVSDDSRRNILARGRRPQMLFVRNLYPMNVLEQYFRTFLTFGIFALSRVFFLMSFFYLNYLFISLVDCSSYCRYVSLVLGYFYIQCRLFFAGISTSETFRLIYFENILVSNVCICLFVVLSNL